LLDIDPLSKRVIFEAVFGRNPLVFAQIGKFDGRFVGRQNGRNTSFIAKNRVFRPLFSVPPWSKSISSIFVLAEMIFWSKWPRLSLSLSAEISLLFFCSNLAELGVVVFSCSSLTQ